MLRSAHAERRDPRSAGARGHKQSLIYFPRGEADRDEADAFLLCPASQLRYRIQQGMPVMLVDEATPLTMPAVEALLARARQLDLAVGDASATR